MPGISAPTKWLVVEEGDTDVEKTILSLGVIAVKRVKTKRAARRLLRHYPLARFHKIVIGGVQQTHIQALEALC